MKIIVKEESQCIARQEIAIIEALRLSSAKLFPIYLEINGKEVCVLPWDNKHNIKEKLAR